MDQKKIKQFLSIDVFDKEEYGLCHVVIVPDLIRVRELTGTEVSLNGEIFRVLGVEDWPARGKILDEVQGVAVFAVEATNS